MNSTPSQPLGRGFWGLVRDAVLGALNDNLFKTSLAVAITFEAASLGQLAPTSLVALSDRHPKQPDPGRRTVAVSARYPAHHCHVTRAGAADVSERPVGQSLQPPSRGKKPLGKLWARSRLRVGTLLSPSEVKAERLEREVRALMN